MALPALGQGVPVNNPGTITINDATFQLGQHIPSAASPFPSAINTSNLVGTIQKVAVTLHSLSHTYAADVDVLLVRTNDNAKIVLLSDVGLGFPFNNVNLTLDATAGSALPAASAINSGTFRPTNVNPAGDVADTWNIGPNGVPGPYDGTLTGLVGSSPNAGWRLYVADDKNVDVGTIGGWTVRIWTTPVFVTVPSSVTNAEDTQFSVAFTINDSDTPLDQLGLSAVSSDTNIIANSAFSLSGSGTTRTLTFTPRQDQFTEPGEPVTVTLRLTDGLSTGASAITTNILVHVTPVNDPPTIALNASSVTTTQGTLTTNVLYAVVADVDDPVDSLTLFATSSNTNIVANDHVFFTRGSNGTNFFSIAPKGAATGTATVQIRVTDAGKSTNSVPIVVTVEPADHAVFGNATSIVIPDLGVASPYPSSVTVSNITGLIGKVTATLADLSHTAPNDLDILLVKQGGTNVVLMGQAGGSNPIENARITFDDDAAGDIPQSAQITSGTYRPRDYSAGNLNSPAPAGPYATSLSAFEGMNPNGTWALYVVDRATGDAGRIQGGFILNIYPAPIIVGLPAAITTNEDTVTTVDFSVGDYDGAVTNVTAFAINPDGSALSGFVNAVATLTGTNVSLRLTPVANVFGTNLVRVLAQDNSGFRATNSFELRVISVNDPPTISTVPSQTTYAGIPVLNVPFTVGDVETPAANLVVTARSSNTKVLPDANIVLGGSGASRNFSLYPVGNEPGPVTVTLTVRDGHSPAAETSTSFALNLLPPASPLFASAVPIIIEDSGAGGGVTNAQPYPSTISVSGLSGQIQKVIVTLVGLQHPFPSDVDILLVGPNNHRVVILSDVGGQDAVTTPIQLVLDDDAAQALPASGPLVPGIYRPTNLDIGGPDVFPGVAAGGTTGTTLASFVPFNITPNGDWSLYVVDDTGNSKGAGATISGGWMINFVTSAQIATIPDQTTQEDVVRRVGISLGDEQPGIPTDITASSSNTTLVDAAGLVFEGTGANRTLVITPRANQHGETFITVTADVGGTLSSTVFRLTVTSVDDPPTIGAIPTQNIPAGLIHGPISFTVDDPDSPLASIVFTATSSNPSLLPDHLIVLSTDSSDPSGRTRLMTLLPNGNDTGSAEVTLVATDNTNQKGSRTFVVNYTENLSYANRSRIEIRDNTTGLPYPSIINVSGVEGAVSRVSVTILGFHHTFPSDAAIMLVSPDNARKVVLLANTGGGAPTNSVSGPIFTFDDSGATLSQNGRLRSGTYRPANFGVDAPGGNFPPPAPTSPYGSELADFNGISPNGDWKLYVFDDTFSEFGHISNGWILVLETAPTLLPIANQTTDEDVTLDVPIFLSDADTPAQNLRTWAESSLQSLVHNTNLTILPTNTLQRTLTIVPTPNANGSNIITVYVADNRTTNSRQFGLIVVPVDDPPIVNTATNLVRINEDSQTNILFTVRDIDSVISRTNATVTSSNESLVRNTSTNLFIADGPLSLEVGDTGEIVVTVVPEANAFGESVLTFSMRDATSTTTRQVTLVVDPINDPPFISGLVSTTNVVAGGSLLGIPFTVGDSETPARNLVVTAESSDQSRIPNANLVLGGADGNRLLSLTTIGAGAGTVNVTVRVSDGELTASAVMAVTISPLPNVNVFANGAAVTIRDNNTAQPYPSTIAVSGLVGGIHTVKVRLNGLSHTAPDDVDVLLVSPSGAKIILLSDAGGSIAVNNAQLLFDAASQSVIPDNGPLVSGTYRPTNYGDDDTFPTVAAPYSGRLTDLVGTNPNGNWSLYVVDDTPGQSGSLQQGWALEIVTGPTIELAAGTPSPLVQNEDTFANATIRIRDADTATTTPQNLSFTYASSNPTLIPPSAPNVVNTLVGGTVASGLDYQFQILPGTNQPASNLRSTNLLTITVVRSTDNAQSSVVITNVVVPVNDAPVISRITQKSTQEGRPLTFSFLVTDVDTLPADLTIRAESLNPSVIASTNLLFFGSTNFLDGLPSNELELTLIPSGDGTATIRITVEDNKTDLVPDQTATTDFLLVVSEVDDPPTITQIPNISLSAGQTSTNIVFTIADPDSSTLTLSATSSDQNLVPNSGIVINTLSGPPGQRTVQVTPALAVIGTTTITIVVSDATTSVPMSFQVNVVESRERSYGNNQRIFINDNGPAAPYPSTIGVSNLIGSVSSIRVALDGFAHRFPQDVDILLVAPNGNRTLLMSDAGGSSAVTNVNLMFDQAGAAISQGAVLTSGTYRPSNYDGANDFFASPAPAGPYTSDLGAFVGPSPLGTWQLFIMDDTPSDSGFVNGGWRLLIETQPRIVGLGSVTVPEDTDFRLPFMIVEEDFVPREFTFRTTSTNAVLVPTNNISFSGSGTNWTLHVQPAQDAFGETDITIFARNPFGQEVSTTIHVTVNAVNDAPFISDIADQLLVSGNQSDPIEINYGDVETPVRNLLVRISSSNTRLVPTNNVVIFGNTLTVIPVGNLTGTSEVTISVFDPEGLSASATFEVNVVPARNLQYANSDVIVIRDNLPAQPYPSTIEVEGVEATVARVTVTLADLTHAFPADIDILLVGPGGEKVILMSDAGGSGSLSRARFTLDDRAASELPFNPVQPMVSGTYRPTNHQLGDVFPSPAPAAPYGTALSAFAGTDPNGTWSLYVVDDAAPDAGTIAGGWILNLHTTDPSIAPIPNQVTPENSPLELVFEIDDADTPAGNLITAASTDNPGLLTLEILGSGNTRTLVITPRAFESGQGNVTITVTDGTGVDSTTFLVTVAPINQPPVLSGLADFVTSANRPARVPFQVSDRETPASELEVTATLAAASLGTLELEGEDEARVLTFRPSGEQGTSFITVIASDNELSTTNVISVTVGAPYILEISPIPDQTVVANQIRTIPLTVTGSESGNVTVTAEAEGTNLVDRVTVTGGGTNFTLSIVLVPNATGSDVITVTATDELGLGTETFNLTVIGLNEPVLGLIPDQRSPVNIPLTVVLDVSDPDTALEDLIYTWTTSNPSVVRNVQFGMVAGGGVVATVFNVADAVGLATVTIFVDDGATKVGQSFLYESFAPVNLPPTLGPIGDRTTTQNVAITIPLVVNDPDTALQSLVFTSSTSNPGLVSGVTFDISTGAAVATVGLVTDATGIATVTINVSDGATTVSRTFAISVTEGTGLPPVLAAPTLTMVEGVRTITVTWTGGGELETAPSPIGPWTAIGNSGGTFSEAATGTDKYYRVRQP